MTKSNASDEPKYGYIKVSLNYAPKTNGKKFAKWCEESGFTPMGGGRRAWSSSLSTYLRGADGVAYADGEPFLFYEEDLVDLEAHTAQAVQAFADEVMAKAEDMGYEDTDYSSPEAFYETHGKVLRGIPVSAVQAVLKERKG